MSLDPHSAVTRYRSLPPSLPQPVAEQWDWQLRGSCRHEDPVLFYPPTSARGRSLAAMEARAKAICTGCPVMRTCRDYALEAAEPHGIWGATTSKERALAGASFDIGPAPTPPAPAPPAVETIAEAEQPPRRKHRIGPPQRPYRRISRPDSAQPVTADRPPTKP
ncbi:WhiB family transcriptional regulator [Rhodococcus sp. 15-649-1-2]|nr:MULTISPECIES: WhiB family transcriptional regulator [unclassified Rhodococcus (in: high G+C Gram-positive bacteria)]OZC86197.1 WhiB family transcriptional regulator [Rhodococcus sp. 06-418-1B]OZE84729.1 WhiB family transcriptional regulator [Rhodococcus sp. 15-649-1-2]